MGWGVYLSRSLCLGYHGQVAYTLRILMFSWVRWKPCLPRRNCTWIKVRLCDAMFPWQERHTVQTAQTVVLCVCLCVWGLQSKPWDSLNGKRGWYWRWARSNDIRNLEEEFKKPLLETTLAHGALPKTVEMAVTQCALNSVKIGSPFSPEPTTCNLLERTSSPLIMSL